MLHVVTASGSTFDSTRCILLSSHVDGSYPELSSLPQPHILLGDVILSGIVNVTRGTMGWVILLPRALEVDINSTGRCDRGGITSSLQGSGGVDGRVSLPIVVGRVDVGRLCSWVSLISSASLSRHSLRAGSTDSIVGIGNVVVDIYSRSRADGGVSLGNVVRHLACG